MATYTDSSRQNSPDWDLNNDSQTITVATAQDPEVPIDPQLLGSDSQILALESQSLDESQTPLSIIDTESQTATRQGTLKWTPAMTTALLTELRDQVRNGKRADNGFKKEAWTTAVIKANEVNDSALVTVKQAQNKVDTIKALYKDWQGLSQASGFGWDEQTQLYTAHPAVWATYISVQLTLYYNSY
jgi:hypothetical protein